MCEKYNGWTNYPTWDVKLWMDNDERIKSDILSIMQKNLNSAEEDKNYIEALKETMLHDIPFGMLFDLLSWAFKMVNWFELAQAYIDDK